MFALTTVLITGGLAYTGAVAYKQLRNHRGPAGRLRRHSHPSTVTVDSSDKRDQDLLGAAQTLTRANRTLTLSSITLGITTAGLVMKPVLMLVSIPAALFIFAPTLQNAWQTIRQERRITPAVLDATRVSLCIIMGYYFALALDTWLRTLTQRLLARTEADFQQRLEEHFVDPPKEVWLFVNGAELQSPLADLAIDDIISVTTGELIPAAGIVLYGVAWVDERLATGNIQVVRKCAGDTLFASTVVRSGQVYLQITAIPEQQMTAIVREQLQRMPPMGSYLAQAGEQSGQKMAPVMLATFALFLPFWGGNRAGGFLTTSFGSQMDRLDPYTLQNFADCALQQNILILDGRALELLNLVNTIVVEASVLTDPLLRTQAHDTLHALRKRRWPMQEVAPHRFAIYLLANGNEAETKELAAALGVDDYFVEPYTFGRAELLERLQTGGRFICYVGSGSEDVRVTEKALVSVAIPTVIDGAAPSASVAGRDTSKRIESTTAQVILIEKDLKHLVQIFELAGQFGTSQGVNLAWPLLMDLVDIGTTTFIHLGLTYSILFSYSGLLGSALYARLRLIRAQQKQQTKPIKPLDPDHQIEGTVRKYE